MRFIDSSIFFAGALESHDRFCDARDFLADARESGAMTSAHALLETYAVLTGMPKPLRFSADDARRYVAYLASHFDVRTLAPKDMLSLIEDLATADIAGGRAYDALHARIAAIAGADAIVTLNKKDFVGFEDRLRVEAP